VNADQHTACMLLQCAAAHGAMKSSAAEQFGNVWCTAAAMFSTDIQQAAHALSASVLSSPCCSSLVMICSGNYCCCEDAGALLLLTRRMMPALAQQLLSPSHTARAWAGWQQPCSHGPCYCNVQTRYQHASNRVQTHITPHAKHVEDTVQWH
jgi:hypothetical protein